MAMNNLYLKASWVLFGALLACTAAARGQNTAPLTVTITQPQNLSFTNIVTATVRGTVSDATASVTVNGINAPVNGGAFQAAVPLVEGNNSLTAVAKTKQGTVGTATVLVTLDTAPPHVTIIAVSGGSTTTASKVSVSGTVNDLVAGTVNNQQVKVNVNGVAANVANRGFLAQDVALQMGNNLIQAVATDRSGNSATASLTIKRVARTQPEMQIVSGNNQTAGAGAALGAPLVVSLVNGAGIPQANRAVVFKVVQNNGSLASPAAVSSYKSGSSTISVVVKTNAQGQASVNWTLGAHSGAGNQRVEASSSGFGPAVTFTATATGVRPALISIDSGGGQFGATGNQLARPFVAVVTDNGHNRLQNVAVTFTVTKGGGAINGQKTLTTNTDGSGRAAAVLTLGIEEGAANNVVQADFTGNPGRPAMFSASALSPGEIAATSISGVVLDNSNQPIPGVTMRLYQPYSGAHNNVPVEVAKAVQTDANGQFKIPGAPVGEFKLMADGGTATKPGPWPTLEFDLLTVAGKDNTVGYPIYLPILGAAGKVCVDESSGGTVTLAEVPGFGLTVAPGSVTFPGGTRSGCVSVSAVHMDKVPMVPGFGQQPRFVVTIQPVGATFNPSAAMTLPNVDGLAPHQVTEMYSFDHDLDAFVAIGTATVSDDGRLVESDPGVGVVKAGWHAAGNPGTPVTAGNCPECQTCVSTGCVADPAQDGKSCKGSNGSIGVCTNGKCVTLQLTAAPTEIDKSPGDSFTVTATGTAASGATYHWNLISAKDGDDPGAFQLVQQPECAGQPSCTAKITVLRPGLATLQVKLTGASGAVATALARLRGIQVSITKIWSDQFPDKPIADFLPGGAGQTGNNGFAPQFQSFILMGARADFHAYAKANFAVSPNNDESKSQVAVSLQQGGMITGKSTINGEEASLSVGAILTTTDYTVAVGFDTSGEHKLKGDQVISTYSGVITVVPLGDYIKSAAALASGAAAFSFTLPTAPLLLGSFVLGLPPSQSAVSSTVISTAALYENVGVLFDSPTGGSIPRYDYDGESSIAKEIRLSSDFQRVVAATISAPSNVNQVRDWFNNSAHSAPSHTFVWPIIGDSIPGSGSTHIIFVGDGRAGIGDDLHLAFGTAELSGNLLVTVGRADCSNSRTPCVPGQLGVASIAVGTKLIDFYKWNYAIPFPDRAAAKVSAGFNTLGGGQVFETVVDLSIGLLLPRPSQIY